MPTNPVDRAAFRFFHRHAGYVVGSRAIGAIRLARAEQVLQEAIHTGTARVVWEDEFDVDMSWIEQYRPCEQSWYRTRLADGRLEVLHCKLETRCPNCGKLELANSLGNIFMLTSEKHHRRVIEAELACEVFLEANR